MYATIKRLSPSYSLPLLWYSWPKARRGEREDDVSLFICNVVAADAERKGKGILHLRNKLHGIDRHSAFGDRYRNREIDRGRLNGKLLFLAIEQGR